MIEFRLDARSGVPTYLQLVQQVKQAVRLGILHPGDQLPTVKEVVASAGDQPEHRAQGISRARPRGPRGGAARTGHVRLEHAARCRSSPTGSMRCARRCERGCESARAAGLDEDTMDALFADTVRPPASDEGGMSNELALRCDGTRQALRIALGAARLHPRDSGRHGHGARRSERRRQDHAAAAGRRPDQGDDGRRPRARLLAAA